QRAGLVDAIPTASTTAPQSAPTVEAPAMAPMEDEKVPAQEKAAAPVEKFLAKKKSNAADAAISQNASTSPKTHYLPSALPEAELVQGGSGGSGGLQNGAGAATRSIPMEARKAKLAAAPSRLAVSPSASKEAQE